MYIEFQWIEVYILFGVFDVLEIVICLTIRRNSMDNKIHPINLAFEEGFLNDEVFKSVTSIFSQ